MSEVIMHVPNEHGVSHATWNAKSNDPRTALWVSGQLWAWENGDCITVLTGHYYGGPCYFVIREGDTITVEQGESITKVMERRGHIVKVRA